jgi:murein DD-endopeptidase MepM/ murein hydrolase activator NlpD
MAAGQSTNPAATDQAQQELQQKLDKAEQQLSANSSNVTQLKKTIDELHGSLKRSEEARNADVAQAHQLKFQMQTLTARANLLKAIVDSKNDQLARLRSLLARPNEQVGQMPTPVTGSEAVKPTDTSLVTDPHKHSALSPRDATPSSAPKPQLAKLETGIAARHSPSRLEQILASTGVDITKMIRHISPQSEPGVGGPFIALDSMRSTAIERRRIAALLKIAKLLPLRSPLAVPYRVGSPFGPRLDPFNHRAAFHPGIDLDAPYRTPVYSTAPGIVIFTGWQEGYGRTVEINHGHGIVTLYAHLHRILVARGEHVAAHVEIGQLGSTGRSTGPHLHYEIRLDGRPVNPEKFLEAGKNVVQASAH